MYLHGLHIRVYYLFHLITREYSSKPRSPEYKNYYTDHVISSISSQELILPPTVSQEPLIKESISQQKHKKSLVLFCQYYDCNYYDSMYTNFYSSPNTSMSTVSTITMNHDNKSVPFNYGKI